MQYFRGYCCVPISLCSVNTSLHHSRNDVAVTGATGYLIWETARMFSTHSSCSLPRLDQALEALVNMFWWTALRHKSILFSHSAGVSKPSLSRGGRKVLVYPYSDPSSYLGMSTDSPQRVLLASKPLSEKWVDKVIWHYAPPLRP